MSPVAIGIIGLAVLFLFMAMGVPIGFAMALVGFGGFAIIGGVDGAMRIAAVVPYVTVATFLISVLPLFLLMGEFCATAGLIRGAYQAGYVWLGHLPGGLAMATIGGCAGFAAVCGSGVATAATVTKVCLPEMLEYKYDPKLATGCIAAGGTLGILIPPSLPLILYGMVANQSVGRLFIAGIFPGILLALMFMITIYILVKRNPLMGGAGARASWRQRLTVIQDVWGILVLFVLVMGGIWGGVFTPTEAAAVGAVVAFLFALGKRRLTWQNLISSFMGTLRTTGMIFAILIGAMIFGYFTAVTRLPMELADFISALPIPRLGVLVCILLVYVFLGCIMDSLAMILLTMPIFTPVVLALGYDPIWFGVIVVLMCEMAIITPPVGMNVFVISGMAKDIPMYTIFRGIFPFVVTIVICVVILIAFPQIATFLPNTMRPPMR